MLLRNGLAGRSWREAQRGTGRRPHARPEAALPAALTHYRNSSPQPESRQAGLRLRLCPVGPLLCPEFWTPVDRRGVPSNASDRRSVRAHPLSMRSGFGLHKVGYRLLFQPRAGRYSGLHGWPDSRLESSSPRTQEVVTHEVVTSSRQDSSITSGAGRTRDVP
jgi:hypothetical protein